MTELPDLRWLAKQVLPRDFAAVDELPAPVLVSTSLTPAVCRYLAWWIRHPNPTGRFAVKTRWLRRLPIALSRRILLALGYDGLLYLNDTDIIGHVFFQRHGEELHVFSGGVNQDLTNRGYLTVMLLDFAAFASRAPGIARARVGTIGNYFGVRLLDQLRANRDRLGWRIDGDEWFIFR